MRNTRKFGQILRSKKRPRPTPRSGRVSRINCNTSRQIPARVIEAENARAVSIAGPHTLSPILRTSLFHRVAGGHRRHSQPELLVCRRRLTNSFFLTDRCSLSEQIPFILASNWRAFILAMRDRDRANKNVIEIFVFSVTSNDFPHDMLLLSFFIENRRCHPLSGYQAVLVGGTGYGLNRNGSTIDSR